MEVVAVAVEPAMVAMSVAMPMMAVSVVAMSMIAIAHEPDYIAMDKVEASVVAEE